MEKFSFFVSYLEQINKIPEEYQLEAYKAICEYALLDKEPTFSNAYADIIFTGVKPVIDSGKRKAEAGRRGGESKQKAEMKQTASKTEANRKHTIKKEETQPKQTASDKDKDNYKDKDKDKEYYMAEFEKLWSMYPKKLGNKKRAFSAYEKARKDGTEYSTVLIGLNAYKAYIKAANVDDQYIMYGSTFFTGNRWADDYTHRPKNAFNIEAHEYDFDELEKELLA